jgi:hypothetical protein
MITLFVEVDFHEWRKVEIPKFLQTTALPILASQEGFS